MGALRSLVVESLSIRGFRNLGKVDIALGPSFNVISGNNGQGKTNFLESIYVLATSKSFRTARLAELVQVGVAIASIRARICEDTAGREQSIGLRQGRRSVRVDGKRPSGLAEYAMQTPVVAFHPGTVTLSAGSGRERRRLLDRVALYSCPASLRDATAYRRAMQARQRLLETRGDSRQGIDEWEELMARHGSALSLARQDAADELAPVVEESFARIGPRGLSLRIRYERSAPETVEAFRTLLGESRAKDRARRSANIGPHRDDLTLELDGRSVRGMASQGQHRAVVLALELAEMEVIARVRGVRPLLLLDDVSSELDRERTAALVATLRQHRGQVLLTTTRPDFLGAEAFLDAEGRRDFVVVRGNLSPA
jgi:DNA replication and repair protein RecF